MSYTGDSTCQDPTDRLKQNNASDSSPEGELTLTLNTLNVGSAISWTGNKRWGVRRKPGEGQNPLLSDSGLQKLEQAALPDHSVTL